MTIIAGASGWNYDSWKGVFYPPGTPKTKWLAHYCAFFNSVEVNATFYRSMKPSTFEKWRESTPDSFVWALKASRYITHIKRLKDPADTVPRFFETARILGPKLGPVLFQLPPNLPLDMDRAREFVQALPKDRRCVVEARHPTWVDDALFALLEEFNIAWCVSDTAGKHPCVRAVTADFGYVRLHGSRILYESEYTEAELQDWAGLVRGWGVDAYVYFDNTMKDGAVRNARRFLEICAAD